MVLYSLNQTQEAIKLLEKDEPPISNISDISYYLKTLESNSSLSLKALIELSRNFKNCLKLKRLFLYRP